MSRGNYSHGLWLASCIHIGAREHDADLLAEYLRQAQRQRWRIALLGDLLDCGMSLGTRHIESAWQNTMTPEQQIEHAIALFRPLRKQIDMVVNGNHPDRVYRLTSIHPEKQIARELGVPYSHGWGSFDWEGRRVVIAHGVSGALYTDVNKMLIAFEGVDIFAIGHTHKLFVDEVQRYVVGHNNRVAKRDILVVRCGSFLRDAEYARPKLYAPTKVGSPLLYLERGKVRHVLGPV